MNLVIPTTRVFEFDGVSEFSIIVSGHPSSTLALGGNEDGVWVNGNESRVWAILMDGATQLTTVGYEFKSLFPHSPATNDVQFFVKNMIENLDYHLNIGESLESAVEKSVQSVIELSRFDLSEFFGADLPVATLQVVLIDENKVYIGKINDGTIRVKFRDSGISDVIYQDLKHHDMDTRIIQKMADQIRKTGRTRDEVRPTIQADLIADRNEINQGGWDGLVPRLDSLNRIEYHEFERGEVKQVIGFSDGMQYLDEYKNGILTNRPEMLMDHKKIALELERFWNDKMYFANHMRFGYTDDASGFLVDLEH